MVGRVVARGGCWVWGWPWVWGRIWGAASREVEGCGAVSGAALDEAFSGVLPGVADLLIADPRSQP